MRKKLWWLIVPLILLFMYLVGPHPDEPVYNKELPAVPAAPAALERYVSQQEAQHRLKPDNEARIVWLNDSLKNKTDHAIVYLHGFSASQAEGSPVHLHTAQKFGCNLYLSRLAEHGIDTTEELVNLTADKYWQSAKEALAIGRKLGKKVILMGTSTGGTLALKLAADYPDVAAVILLSPNIAINDPNAWVLNNPWGLQIARMVKGSAYINSQAGESPAVKQYWNDRYRLEAAVALEELLETTMTRKTFEQVKQPALLLYYYKDDIHQDSVVRVDAMQKMFAELGTPAGRKRAVAIPNAGAHVLASPLKSKDVKSVQKEIDRFLEEVVMK